MRIVIHKSNDGQFYFELRARNGKIVAVSETFKRKQSCKNTIESIMSCKKFILEDMAA